MAQNVSRKPVTLACPVACSTPGAKPLGIVHANQGRQPKIQAAQPKSRAATTRTGKNWRFVNRLDNHTAKTGPHKKA